MLEPAPWGQEREPFRRASGVHASLSTALRVRLENRLREELSIGSVAPVSGEPRGERGAVSREERASFGHERRRTVGGDLLEHSGTRARQKRDLLFKRACYRSTLKRVVDRLLLSQQACVKREKRCRRSGIGGELFGPANASIPRVAHDDIIRGIGSRIAPETCMEPQRITADEVKRREDSGEAITFLDARADDAWRKAELQIRGSIRVPPDEVGTRVDRIPRRGLVVPYCT